MSSDDTAPKALATLAYCGVPVQVDLLALDAEQLALIERRLGKLLAREGWAPPPVARGGGFGGRGGGQRKPQDPPHYAPDGTPCCPKHPTKPLKQGNYGLYCSARTETGFCDFTFKDEKR